MAVCAVSRCCLDMALRSFGVEIQRSSSGDSRAATREKSPQDYTNLVVIVLGKPLALHNAIADRALVLDDHLTLW